MPNTVIAVDVMGGDFAPDVVVEGIAAALAEDPNLEVLACGLPEVVEPLAGERCRALAASQVIDMEEHPANAVRAKKDSSIVVGCKAVKAGEADGFYSAGSTGAVLVAGTLHIGRIRRISRPMLGTVIPSATGPVLLCDVGANADCKPEYLQQFAIMGSAYMQGVMGVESPRVGLVNNGAEESKGSELAKAAHALLKETNVNFKGNCEGRDIFSGDFDVVVTDGFTGNIILKEAEGFSSALFKIMKRELTSSFITKIGAAIAKPAFKSVKKIMDYKEYGGAPLLGINGGIIKAHGSSDSKAFLSAIRQARKYVLGGVTEKIASGIAQIEAQ